MRIALKELLRQPGRFAPVGGALTLLVVLLAVLGGFLDGLELVQTGAYRAHEGTVIVFGDDAERQLQRSRVSAEEAEAFADTPGVDDVGTLSQVATVAGPPDGTTDDLLDVALFGYDLGTDDLPAPPGGTTAVVDAQLAEQLDLAEGDTVEIGPTAVAVTVGPIVDDLTQGSPTVWLASDAWREVAADAAPNALPPEGVSQALVLDTDLAPAEVADLGPGDPVTPAEAIEALDVVQQQSSTFQGIISVTFAVTLLVVALFFALITLERVGLYAVLKAIGARSSDLILGLSAQAVAISAVALVLGIGASLAFAAALPPELPVRLVPARLAAIAAGTVVTALVGSLLTLRRILAVDPAEAIG